MNINDEHSSGESLGVFIPQGSMSPIHVNTPNTLGAKNSRLINEEEYGEDENVEIVSTPQTEKIKNLNKVEWRIISISSTNVQERPSGETPSPIPNEVLRSSNLDWKGREIK